jgi:hypothetical protein
VDIHFGLHNSFSEILTFLLLFRDYVFSQMPHLFPEKFPLDSPDHPGAADLRLPQEITAALFLRYGRTHRIKLKIPEKILAKSFLFC